MNRWLSSTVDTYLKHFGATSAPVVYDVGSRDNEDGAELAQRIYHGMDFWHDSDLVVFECNPPQIALIKQSTNIENFTLITEAVSDKQGTVEFLQIHGDKNFVGSSTMNTARNDSWIKETSTIKVKTRRLDDVIEELGHQNTEIDIMKIDIEGYTFQALQSLGKYLRNVRVFHLETEIQGYARAETNLDIAIFMQEHGYTCSSIEGEWLPNIVDQVWYRDA